MINIAVMGYGTVGSGVVEVVNTNGARINQRIGDELNIKYVLDLKDFPGNPVQEKIIHDFETIIQDDDVQIVVEVMGGIEPAYTFVKRCLQAGKSVATSNKALVAKHGAELLSIAKENEINFLFEASGGGGIPIIRHLNSSLTADWTFDAKTWKTDWKEKMYSVSDAMRSAWDDFAAQYMDVYYGSLMEQEYNEAVKSGNMVKVGKMPD